MTSPYTVLQYGKTDTPAQMPGQVWVIHRDNSDPVTVLLWKFCYIPEHTSAHWSCFIVTPASQSQDAHGDYVKIKQDHPSILGDTGVVHMSGIVQIDPFDLNDIVCTLSREQIKDVMNGFRDYLLDTGPYKPLTKAQKRYAMNIRALSDCVSIKNKEGLPFETVCVQ